MTARQDPTLHNATVQIVVDDLSGPRIAAFLEEHIAEMRATSPPESKHALDLDGLRAPGITFWTALDDDGDVLGCAALKRLGDGHGELKSMRVAVHRRGEGIAARLLVHVLDAARAEGLTRISLETGSFDHFAPARRLYARHGFTDCPPFADYRPDPNSVFMTLAL